MFNYKNIIGILSAVLTISCAQLSCKKFVHVDLPSDKITNTLVFESDQTAISAILGIYYNMLSSEGFASGSVYQGITNLAGLSSDELINYDKTLSMMEFENNEIDPINEDLFKLWQSMYKTIYQANSALEGINTSTKITVATKNQLIGEVLFVRAFCNFYLVNIFGNVPLIKTTDYKQNQRAVRVEKNIVYDQIIEDLSRAKELLSNTYPQFERITPNRMTAIALLARTYLYIGDWQKAEAESSIVISSPDYELESDVNNVFLSTSKEAIWQLKQVISGYNTFEGYYFLSMNGVYYNKLRSTYVTAFEQGDNRFINWVKSGTGPNGDFLYPEKYKVPYGQFVSEYSIVFRIAEQYLIRAEAKIQNGDISGGVADLNILRSKRRGPAVGDLPELSSTMNKEEAQEKLEHERKVELFTEWGHRWFDLKRWNKTDEILSSLKQNWNSSDVLYPIPQREMDNNPFLIPQNPGY